jgi:hypothetical protein
VKPPEREMNVVFLERAWYVVLRTQRSSREVLYEYPK